MKIRESLQALREAEIARREVIYSRKEVADTRKEICNVLMFIEKMDRNQRNSVYDKIIRKERKRVPKKEETVKKYKPREARKKTSQKKEEHEAKKGIVEKIMFSKKDVYANNN